MAKSKRNSWMVLRNFTYSQSTQETKIFIKVEKDQILEQAEVFEFGKYIPKKYADILVKKEVLSIMNSNSATENV